MLFAELDFLLSHRCPRCGAGLRFRRLARDSVPGRHGPETAYLCRQCKARLVERMHPALSDNWRWSRFTLPPVLFCALTLFVPALNGLLPWAVATMVLGVVGLLAYMIRERLRSTRYVLWRDPLSPEVGG